MSESGSPPVPPASSSQDPAPAHQVPAGAPALSQAAYEQPASTPRSHAWLWWTVGILMVLALVVTSCTLPFLALFGGGSVPTVSTGKAVAVIRVDGVIAGTGDTYGGYITPESFLNRLEQAEDDSRVRAVVLRVDSPGGTVAASEEISEYVSTCPKPVVVSIGDVGASGAYMISSQADEIWANQGSSVGSIGVIAQIPNASGLLDTLGVEFQTITAGEYKDTGSPYRPLTKKERALIQGEVEEAYDQFIDIVAEGRGLERSKVEELAIGWTWSGEKAKELDLIDKVGTYRDALDAAAESGIEGDYDVVTYDDGLKDLFSSFMGISAGLGQLRGLSEREAAVRRSLPR